MGSLNTPPHGCSCAGRGWRVETARRVPSATFLSLSVIHKLIFVEHAGTGLESSDDQGSADAAAAEGDDADPATAASAAAKRLRKKRDKISKKKRKQEGQEPAQEAGDSASKKSRLKKRRIEGGQFCMSHGAATCK